MVIGDPQCCHIFSKPLLYITVTDKQSYLYQPSVAYFADGFLRMFAPNGPGWCLVFCLAQSLFLSIELFNFLGYCMLQINPYIAIVYSSKLEINREEKEAFTINFQARVKSVLFNNTVPTSTCSKSEICNSS